MLLAKTLRSSTFGLALLLIGIFGAAVIALLSYVYWSTASYVRSRADHAIAAELALLEAAYDGAGRTGLTAAIAQRIAGKQLEGGVYLLADASFAPSPAICRPGRRVCKAPADGAASARAS